MYLLMFLAAIVLRMKAPNQQRSFRIPGGMSGMLFVAGLGLVGVLTTFCVSFMPPEGIDVGNVVQYEMSLVIGLMLMSSPPLVWSWWQTRRQAVAVVAAGG